MKKSESVLFNKDSVIHLVGIGGVSMSALAEALSARGAAVRGSDMQRGVHTERLAALGIEVFIGHRAENIEGAHIIIRTSAIHDDNPEIARAMQLGIPVLERAQAWGILMEEFDEVVCIAGTHGKTSTTAMMTCIALEAGRDPEVMIGADMREISGVFRIASSGLFIAEACEYCNSFLNFKPTVGVVLNVEEDHLDFFSGIDDIIKSFSSFMSNVKNSGIIVVNHDDANAMCALSATGRSAITFGLREGADVTAKNLHYTDGYPSFTLSYNGEELCEVRLSVIGEHNVKNALAAAAAALAMRIPAEKIATALAKFTGVGRRMEYKGDINGAKVYDDYAHHPSEIEATLKAVRKSTDGRVICAFQPHTYTRTAALKADFANALSLADVVVLADIYAAREKNEIGITSAAIGELMHKAKCISGFDEISRELAALAKAGDVIITMGAGDIYKVGEMLTERQ